MPDILDSIDGALSDWHTSDDAMRWLPEHKREPRAEGGERASMPPAAVTVSMDTEEFARALNEFAEAMTRVFRPVIEDTVKAFHGLGAAFFPSQHRRCLTCHPSQRPKPLAVNGHEYHRRQMARRRRRR